MELQKLYVTLALDAQDFKTGMATVTGIVAAGAIAASAAVAAVAIGGVKAAIGMEEQMSGIAAIFSTTVDQIQPLGDLIKDLGLNPNLKVNATEAADAIEMLGKNGLTMAEILDGAAESTVLLANSTGADFAVAANIGTDAMALFNIEAKDMSKAVDGITAVTVNSKFGINDYALALAQGGGVASSVGVTFSDFNATIAGISPLFKSGSDAGTSLKTMLLRLNPATDAAAEAMGELGLLTEEGGSAFFDAHGKMLPMSEVAGLMDDAFGDLSDAQRISTMQTIFGTDAMRAAVGMMDLGEEGFKDLSDTMGQTDAMAAAATRMDNLSGAMEIFEGIVDTAQLSLGQALLPVIRMFVDWLIVLADTWMPKVEAGLAAVTTVISLFFANLSEGMTVLDAFLLAIEQFIPPELYAKIIEIKDAISELWAQIVTFLTPIWEAITAFVSFQDVLIGIGIAIAVTIIPIIISLIASFTAFLAPILLVIAFVALLRHAWEEDFAGIRDFAASIWDAIMIAVDAFRLLFAGDWEGFLEKIKEAWSTAWNATVTFLGNIWTIIKPKLTALWNSFVTWFNDTDWLALAIKIMTAISAGLSAFWDWIKPYLVTLWTSFSTWFVETDWKQVAIDLMVAISEALDAFWTWIKPYLVTLWESLVTWFEDTDWEQLAEDIMTAISDALDDFWDWISEAFDNMWESAKTWFTETIDWKSLGTAIIDGVKNGITAGIEKLKTAARNAAQAALDAAKALLGITSPSSVARDEVGLQFSSGIALGIVDGLGAIMEAINTVAGKVESETISKFAKAASAVFDMIGSAIDATRQLSRANFPEIVQGWHLAEQMDIFKRIVNTLMLKFEEIAGEMEADHSKALQAYAKAADEIFSLIEIAIEGSIMLSEINFAEVVQGWHLRDQIIIFRKIVATVMREFQIAAGEMKEGASKEVEAFAKAATELFELIEVAIAGAIKLSETDFSAIVQGFHLADQIQIFRRIIATMLREFELVHDEFGTERIDAIAGLAKNINQFVEHMGEIINGVFAIIDELEQFIGASVPAGLSGLMQQMNDVLRAAVLPAYNVGLEIGNALTRGITEAISAGLVPVGAAVDGMIPRPGMPLAATAGAGPSTAGANGSRTVILENGAFQVVINDAMDAEEFKFTVVEIIRELTE